MVTAGSNPALSSNLVASAPQAGGEIVAAG